MRCDIGGLVRLGTNQVWWCTPLIPAVTLALRGRDRGQRDLQNKFQNILYDVMMQTAVALQTGSAGGGGGKGGGRREEEEIGRQEER